LKERWRAEKGFSGYPGGGWGRFFENILKKNYPGKQDLNETDREKGKEIKHGMLIN